MTYFWVLYSTLLEAKLLTLFVYLIAADIVFDASQRRRRTTGYSRTQISKRIKYQRKKRHIARRKMRICILICFSLLFSLRPL